MFKSRTYQQLFGATAGDIPILNSGKTALEWSSTSSLGHVVGPASSTDNAVPRYDGTTGKLIQDSGVIVDDSDNISGVGTVSSGAITSSSLTASEIVISDASKVISSAPVATYPSLTELAYVKGATSTIQTQIDAKGVGDVASSTTIIDNAIVRGDGGAKGVQDSLILVDDSANVTNMGTLGCGAITSGADTDIETVLGKARFNSPTSDNLYLSHYDNMTTANYALRQNASGQTRLNSKTGQMLILAIGNANALTVNSDKSIDLDNSITGELIQSGGVANESGTTYAPALGDEGNYVVCTNASAIAVTIPANASVAFAIGTEIHFEQGGAGAITVGITSDTLNVNANLTKVTNGQYSVCTIKKIAATTWTIFGNLVAA